MLEWVLQFRGYILVGLGQIKTLYFPFTFMQFMDYVQQYIFMHTLGCSMHVYLLMQTIFDTNPFKVFTACTV